jgi:cytochrome b involved in lipid metabolism
MVFYSILTYFSTPTPTPTPTPTAPSSEGGYALSDVQAHASSDSCWTVVDGSVYDLTTWISRHPGGARPIQGMCGIDSTERFTRKHGKSGAAKAALVLLKIGTLKK